MPHGSARAPWQKKSCLRLQLAFTVLPWIADRNGIAQSQPWYVLPRGHDVVPDQGDADLRQDDGDVALLGLLLGDDHPLNLWTERTLACDYLIQSSLQNPRQSHDSRSSSVRDSQRTTDRIHSRKRHGKALSASLGWTRLHFVAA